MNDAPVVTAPGTAYSFSEQGSLNIHGTGFSLADVDDNGGTLTATFSVGEGRVLIDAGDSGVTVISGDRFTSGNSTDTVTFSGTKTQINALLSGTSYGYDCVLPRSNGQQRCAVGIDDNYIDCQRSRKHGYRSGAIPVMVVAKSIRRPRPSTSRQSMMGRNSLALSW